MLPEKVLARKSDTVNLHWSISKLERDNQGKRWSRKKMDETEYDVSSLNWSTDPNMCFKQHQSGDPRQGVSYSRTGIKLQRYFEDTMFSRTILMEHTKLS